MALDLEQYRRSREAALPWPSMSFASAQLCRPQLRVVEPSSEIRLETSAVLSLAAISIDGGAIAVDGVLDASAAGTTLDINGIPVRIHPSGELSTVFDLPERRTLTVTMTLALPSLRDEDRFSRRA